MRLQRHQQKGRKQYLQKLGLACLIAVTMTNIGCRGQRAATPVAKEPDKPKGFEPYPEKVLTEAGRNQKGVFSPDETSVFYLGSDRSSHSHWQIYQLFLTNGQDKNGAKASLPRERRVTFHDGDVESVQVTAIKNAIKIFYASATDEIKESPDFIRQSLNKDLKLELDFFSEPLPRTEIYESDLNGDKIERLTRSPGFDGDLAIRPSHSEIAFVSYRSGDSDIFIHNTRSSSTNKIISKKDHEWSPSISSQNELAFVRGKISEQTSRIYVSQLNGDKERAITEIAAINTDPNWHPSGEWIVFSSNHPDPLNFELYRIRRDGKCLERLTYTAAHERFPHHSPDGKSLLLTRISGSDRQVVMISDLPAPVDCDPPSAEANQ